MIKTRKQRVEKTFHNPSTLSKLQPLRQSLSHATVPTPTLSYPHVSPHFPPQTTFYTSTFPDGQHFSIGTHFLHLRDPSLVTPGFSFEECDMKNLKQVQSIAIINSNFFQVYLVFTKSSSTKINYLKVEVPNQISIINLETKIGFKTKYN